MRFFARTAMSGAILFLTGDNVRVRLKDMSQVELKKILSNEGFIFAKVEIDELGGLDKVKETYKDLPGIENLQVVDTNEEPEVEIPKPPSNEELLAKLAELEAKLAEASKPSEPVKSVEPAKVESAKPAEPSKPETPKPADAPK